MAIEPKDYTIFIWMILTSNTEATENKVQFFNLAYLVKEFQCHSNNSATAWIEGKKQQQNNTRYLKVFFLIFFS